MTERTVCTVARPTPTFLEARRTDVIHETAHARISQGHAATTLDYTRLYNLQLRDSLLRDDGAAYGLVVCNGVSSARAWFPTLSIRSS